MLLVAAGAAVAVPIDSIRPFLVVGAASIVPGAAILTRMKVDGTLIAAALAVGLSLMIDVACGLALAWSGFWHPLALGAGVGVGSAALLLLDLRDHYWNRLRARAWTKRRSLLGLIAIGHAWMADGSGSRVFSAHDGVWRVRVRMLAQFAPLALGLLGWATAVHTLSHVSLETQEVPNVLPATWWIGVVLLLGGSVFTSCSTSPRPWLVGAYVAALAVVLFGTLPAVLDAPQYSWTYKLIGVVQLIEHRGTVSPGVDIYNRWPGFFSAAAALSQLMGLPHPVAYAAWAELFFAWIDALLVAALAWSILYDARIAGLAAVLFTMGNWIGQDYFSPQATAFALSLALLLVAMRHFTSGANGRAIRLVERLVRRPQPSAGPADVRPGESHTGRMLSSHTAPAVILLFDAAIAATHQLTPYVLLLQLGGLAATGILRPRWILPAMVAITIGYLLPNLRYVSHNYGLFSGLDPFANGQAAASTSRPVNEPWIDQHAGQLLSFLFLAGAAIASVVLARRGLARRALPIVILAVMPAGLLFGQSYGGEAPLRVFLFSGPWCATLMAWAVVVWGGSRDGPFVALGLSALIVALFVPAFFGQTWVNIMPADEVAASSYFYDHAPVGSALVLVSSNFPSRVGARYAVMARSLTDPELLSDAGLEHKPLGAEDIGATIALMRSYSDNAFIAFSTSGEREAQVDGLTPPGAVANLERAVAASPQFELWHQTPNARIYRLVDRAGASAPRAP